MSTLVPVPGLVLANPSGCASDGELVELWIANQPSMQTRRAYRLAWARFSAWSGGIDLARITVRHLEQWRGTLAGLAPSSRNQYMDRIRSLLTYSYDRGYLNFNPGRGIGQEQAPASIADRIFTAGQIQDLLNCAPRDSAGAAMMLNYYAAARISELLAIRWNDFGQLEDGTPTVRLTGKGGKRRIVPVDSRALFVVRRYCEMRGPGARVLPFQQTYYRESVALAAGQAGLQAFTPHCFRHSRLSHLAQAGVPLAQLRDFAGHANIATTNIYLHCAPAALPDTLQ